MRFNCAGGLGAEFWDTASDDRPDLPEAVQSDVDRVADVIAAGFQSPVWHQMADELYSYAFGRLCAAMRRTDKLMNLTAKSETPLSMTDENRGTLCTAAPRVREHLAILTLNVAMESFPKNNLYQQASGAQRKHDSGACGGGLPPWAVCRTATE